MKLRFKGVLSFPDVAGKRALELDETRNSGKFSVKVSDVRLRQSRSNSRSVVKRLLRRPVVPRDHYFTKMPESLIYCKLQIAKME